MQLLCIFQYFYAIIIDFFKQVLAKSSSEGSSKQVPFLIDSANELLIENWESKGLLIEKVACVLSSKELKTEAKERQRGLKRQRNTPKANQQEKNVEEIIFPKGK